ncbi:bifunctional diaminohydroxyphosphoribosylaminopyrimidine deaminase/5-amino-6-(5-phosphoribosylamino)uracil reductase RibD [Maribacter algarum]|uniref:Riboflavin biosynthesis protein RibD n=1 Tax=Maribacter algarum (ex Zhang et al. 2020) TaxID=2578118 RepID=A0A5S3PHA4_9FLAO|nr:bifunctional diaminohydroxyphosphoribosylaminopyrimidine deaminase/5-amino-6-(5-phosphoribosylamino)uracil reductase RibD [Maribacter algarum]TMM53619.1 bifunctional diaminohydroxyphosphoribosylaminopyrimidine deaminase/5-amino-6-(5-phosphoribosylamino)uracil reductase RibD [Maribacter algarum]
MKIHQKYMLRCIEIAQNGLGIAAPNPMVGAVIVYNDEIIGEGFTSAYGKSHAEVNAIQSVRDKTLLKKATLYVTLEPCCHYGKTPPCADLIIDHQIPHVVVGVLDPNEKVAGKGIEKLKKFGCDVTCGILEKECREHHKRFLTFYEKKRPYIILKWAETLDGFIAPEKGKRGSNPEPYWITNARSRQMVHQWRTEELGILVGTNTVLEDNPKLDARHWKGKNPFRIILDKDLKIPEDYHVLDESIPTMLLTEVEEVKKDTKGEIHYQYLDFSMDLAKQICEILPGYNLTSILIEGGSKTLQTFIDAGLWDEARVFTGNTSLTKGIKAPEFSGKLINSQNIESDHLKIYRND